MSKLEYIKSIFHKYCIKSTGDLTEESIEIIYQLYKNDYLDESRVISVVCAKYIGIYYHIINKNNTKAEKYYLMAISDFK